ncbi:hypothetical protein ATM97_07205 [Nocardia sp. MH4]|uniref:hypothetical protein n=1 Tax=Nocardia sp. MH4 TaxID=1768677 RepID=UPI001C4EDCC9|nr:hypothetical protein [Nocardia sp. MH4]MBW0270799.1 hypothetical protein [Nocardia sp. MH4]
MIGEIARLDGHDDDQARPVAWRQRDDGSWSVIDEYGVEWPVAAFTLAELDADVQSALGAIGDPVDVAPLSVTDTEVDR